MDDSYMEMPSIDRRASSQLVPRELWEVVEKNRNEQVSEIKSKLSGLDSKYNKILFLLLANLAGLIAAILQGGGFFK